MWFVNLIYYIIPFIVLLSILVFVHEFGHFLIARLLGVQVSAFSIGFGKALWSREDKHGTVWKISAVPLGGYCQFLGDGDASSSSSDGPESLTDEQKKHAFAFQNPLKKLAIVLAGPGFNYLLAIIIYFVLFASFGKFSVPPIVAGVMENSAAAAAGLEAGDRIINIHRVVLKVLRDGKTLDFDITLTQLDKEQRNHTVQKQYMLGVKSVSSVELSHEKLSVADAFVQSCAEVWNVTRFYNYLMKSSLNSPICYLIC